MGWEQAPARIGLMSVTVRGGRGAGRRRTGRRAPERAVCVGGAGAGQRRQGREAGWKTEKGRRGRGKAARRPLAASETDAHDGPDLYINRRADVSHPPTGQSPAVASFPPRLRTLCPRTTCSADWHAADPQSQFRASPARTLPADKYLENLLIVILRSPLCHFHSRTSAQPHLQTPPPPSTQHGRSRAHPAFRYRRPRASRCHSGMPARSPVSHP